MKKENKKQEAFPPPLDGYSGWVPTKFTFYSYIMIIVSIRKIVSNCAGMILHLGSEVVRMNSFNPMACCRIKRSQQLPKVYQSSPILITHIL
jgi:hypothetical protein